MEDTTSVAIQKSAVSVAPRSMGGLIPTDLEQLWRMATMIFSSGFAPNGMKKPEAVAVAIQMGLEVGLSPMQAVQNIAVINGRPNIWGDAALGLVQASGKLEEFDEWEEGERFKPGWTAFCKAKRTGDKKAKIGKFSWADAERAGLSKADPSSPWTKYPQRMLQMRARSWVLRDKFADVLKGLQVREEVQDYVDLTPTANGSYEVKTKTEETLSDLKDRITEAQAPTPPEPENADTEQSEKPDKENPSGVSLDCPLTEPGDLTYLEYCLDECKERDACQSYEDHCEIGTLEREERGEG